MDGGALRGDVGLNAREYFDKMSARRTGAPQALRTMTHLHVSRPLPVVRLSAPQSLMIRQPAIFLIVDSSATKSMQKGLALPLDGDASGKVTTM